MWLFGFCLLFFIPVPLDFFAYQFVGIHFHHDVSLPKNLKNHTITYFSFIIYSLKLNFNAIKIILHEN